MRKSLFGAVPCVPLATLTVFAASVPVWAQGINVTVDGEVIGFTGQPPIQQAGTVLVPLRGGVEKLGAAVAYDPPTKTILAVKGPTSVSLQLGKAVATVNGEQKQLALPAQAINGTTLVPLRFVSEALGAQVQWKGASRTVVISTNGAPDIVSNPANPGPGTPTADLTVTSLTHTADQPLKAGDVLTVTLQGTPGGQAVFTVPGIEGAKSVAMEETSSGNYVGKFTVPKNLNARGAVVLGYLKKGGQVSTTLQAARALTVDSAGPTVDDLSPAPNASLPPGKPLIYGTFSDAGTGVEEGAVRLLVNGKDLTSQATITPAFFSFRPEADLPMGKNAVVVVARDTAGNETRKGWEFNISAEEALIKTLTYTPMGQTLEPGDEITVKMTARPGGTARFNVGGAVTGRTMQETSPGVYSGSYTVKKGDSLAQAPISVAFTVNGRTVTQTANQPLTIAAGAPDKPTITQPGSGASVGEKVTIRGTAAPNATVRYHLTYQARVAVLSTNGTVTDGEVKANEKGEWVIPEVTLTAPFGIKDITYTLEVATVGAAGETSEAASVQFKR